MGRFVVGTDRAQATLFSECLEDWICADNPVRAIDVFVDELDPKRTCSRTRPCVMSAMRFRREPGGDGRRRAVLERFTPSGRREARRVAA
jgi:hypothetical protein